MKTRTASGWASTLRVCHTIAPTANFKTRFDPCRIAVLADIEKSEQFTKHRTRGTYIYTSSGDQQSRISSCGRLLPIDRTRNTENRHQPPCGIIAFLIRRQPLQLHQAS